MKEAVYQTNLSEGILKVTLPDQITIDDLEDLEWMVGLILLRYRRTAKRQTEGYSASVTGFLVIGEQQFQTAKTNHLNLSLAEPCHVQVPPQTQAKIAITVDGSLSERNVILPDGIQKGGQFAIRYQSTEENLD